MQKISAHRETDITRLAVEITLKTEMGRTLGRNPRIAIDVLKASVEDILRTNSVDMLDSFHRIGSAETPAHAVHTARAITDEIKAKTSSADSTPHNQALDSFTIPVVSRSPSLREWGINPRDARNVVETSVRAIIEHDPNALIPALKAVGELKDTPKEAAIMARRLAETAQGIEAI